MGLCDECKKAMTFKGYRPTPVDHCHHDEQKEKPDEEKCWCKSKYKQRTMVMYFPSWYWPTYCPDCGRKMEV